MRSMRGLALCLLAGALLVAGCGSNNASTSASAPKAAPAATTAGGATQTAAVSGQGHVTPASLCTPEGGGKPRRQCVKGLTKLGNGKAKNPAAACKGLSKKKTKGTKGKSPYAVCVAAAAKLMAAKNPASTPGNGSADTSGTGTDTSADSSSSDSTDTSGLECVDVNGNPVSIDDPNLDSCTDTSASSGDTSGQGSSSDGTDTTDTTSGP